jgi:hypothetical protein
MEDSTLRGSSAHEPEALVPWKQIQPKYKVAWIPLSIDIAFAALFIILTAKTLWRRAKLYMFLDITRLKRETSRPNRRSEGKPSSETSLDSNSHTANNTGKEATGTTAPSAPRKSVRNSSLSRG